jgi:hypothetical protein
MRLENINKITENSVIFQNIWQFLFISKLKNSWISDDDSILGIAVLDVYLRKSRRIINGQTHNFVIDVANILVYEKYQKSGYFRKLILELQKYGYPIYIESVVNSHFKKSLIENKHGLNLSIVDDSQLNPNYFWIPEKLVL